MPHSVIHNSTKEIFYELKNEQLNFEQILEDKINENFKKKLK
jgi:hypothetical protein